MSKIVLCETKPAKVPYKIAKIGRSFLSYEEFCWLLEHYLIFFLTEGFEYPLKNYLKEQLDIVIKSDDAVQQVKEVINYYNYFTSDEKIQFQQKLRTTYLYSAAKKQKLLADMYLKHQLYVRALIAYQKLETVSGKLNAAEQIQVLYHMGLCQSRMFCFEEAKESFAMALRIKEDKQIQEAYFTAAYLAGDEEAFLEAGRKISFDEDQCKMIYQNIKEKRKRSFQKEEFDKLGKIDYHRKKADENITRRLIKTTLGSGKMNTKRRLSDDLSNDSEILSEKRFVKLYKEELESIEKQIHDLKKLDQKDFDVKPEVEDKARLYYRTFAREFYDVCEGRVSDEEFFDLWEREEELKAGLNSINSLEGEQKQLEKELVHANEDETMMNGKIKAAQEKRRNKKALFISFLCMAAAVCE